MEKILNMLKEGKIDVSEAQRLLDALEEPQAKGKDAKFLRIQVDSPDEKGDRVNVKIPLAFIKAGVKFAGLIPEKTRSKVQDALKEKGIDFDLADLKSADLDSAIASIRELEVTAHDAESGESVRIFCD